MRKYEEVAVEKLREHPENAKWFSDIKDTSETFWQEFKDNISRLGIIEALIVNPDTMEVVSGNQRLKAAIELGFETIPVIYRQPEDKDTETEVLVSSNVFRRDIDPLTLFEYIGWLRRNYSPTNRDRPPGAGELPTTGNIAQKMGKRDTFVAAADYYNSLPEEEKQRIREWVEADQPTDKELIEEVKQAERERLNNEIEKAQSEAKTEADKREKLEELADVRADEIKKLKANTDTNAEELRKLQREHQTLKDKLEDYKEEAKAKKALETLASKMEKIKKDSQNLATSIASMRRLAAWHKLDLEGLAEISKMEIRSDIRPLIDELLTMENAVKEIEEQPQEYRNIRLITEETS